MSKLRRAAWQVWYFKREYTVLLMENYVLGLESEYLSDQHRISRKTEGGRWEKLSHSLLKLESRLRYLGARSLPTENSLLIESGTRAQI